ncbi:PREDICTED: uncharacterized protein LOC105450208 isoform X3 [Wasmannia auropunctata]|uniref:uncharacterized protein LOC105450208 isoform X3 n=1 Tax=Wasmannia auropunctata TaxID=64793 RepID=UPI0005ED9185|nr:PREDICTED: uncharacterized protein LOC105450208 isoform X3 [Wasmannia auropunctata]
MDDDQRPFVVIKFINKTIKKGSDDDTAYEVGLAKWIVDLNEDMIGTTKWPPPSVDAGKLIRKEASPNSNWPVSSVEVIRYFDTVRRAREALKRLVDEGLTSYETERELGRGKRKKRPPTKYTDDDEDSDISEYSKKKQQSLSDDSDSTDSVPRKKTEKFVKSKNIVEDIPSPPSLSFQNKTEKIRSQKTERQRLSQKLKEGHLKNALKKQMSALNVPQLNASTKSRLQQVNTTPYQNNIILLTDEEENIVDEPEAKIDEFGLGISSEGRNSFKSLGSRNTEVFSSFSTPLRSSSPLYNMNSRNSGAISRELFSCHQDILQDANNSEDLDVPMHSKKKQFLSDDSNLSFDISKSITEIKSLCKTTLVRIEELSSKVDVTIMNQARLNRSLLPAEKRIVRPPDLPTLPVHTEDDLKAIERFLDDVSNLAATVHYLASYSLKSSEEKAAAQVMTKLISNTLASSYNFKGTEGSKKKSFQNLHLWEVVQGVIQTRFPESDLSHAKNSVMSWLRNAPWRKQEEGSDTWKRKNKSSRNRNESKSPQKKDRKKN